MSEAPPADLFKENFVKTLVARAFSHLRVTTRPNADGWEATGTAQTSASTASSISGRSGIGAFCTAALIDGLCEPCPLFSAVAKLNCDFTSTLATGLVPKFILANWAKLSLTLELTGFGPVNPIASGLGAIDPNPIRGGFGPVNPKPVEGGDEAIRIEAN